MARGGKREGAGRPTGTRWKPAVAAFRHDAAEKQAAIIAQEDDPLSVVASWVLDTNMEINFRLSAANACLPFLYPKLSASRVDANHVVTKVDATDLLKRIDERIAKLAAPIVLDAVASEPDDEAILAGIATGEDEPE